MKPKNNLLTIIILILTTSPFWPGEVLAATVETQADAPTKPDLARGDPWPTQIAGPKKWKTLWVDEQGGQGDSAVFEAQQNWAWPKSGSGPVLETVLSLPVGYSVTDVSPVLSIEGLGSQRISFGREWSDAPVSVRISNPSGKTSTYSLMQMPLETGDGRWVHTSCEDAEISLETLSAGGAQLLAVRCEAEKNAVILQVYYSPDLEVVSHTGGLALGAKQSGFKLRYVLPPTHAATPTSLGVLEFKDRHGKVLRHTVLWKANVFRRWGFSAATALGYVNYAEPSNAIVVGQGVWVLRGQFDFTFIRKRLDASVGTAFTLLPVALGVTPARTPAGRFFGVWGKVGYWLPLPLAAIRFQVSAGYQYRMSLVESNAYGFRYYGPQIGVKVASTREGKGAFSGTFRYTPVASGIAGFSVGNYEFALQTAYAVTTLGQVQIPLWILLDFDVARGASADQVDVIQTWGLTAGVGVSF